MVASRLDVLWHKIVLSSPVWFALEVVTQKPWQWSLYSSLMLSSFIPITVLIAFIVGSMLSSFTVLLVIQCGLLTLAIASFLSTIAVLAPLAITIAFLIFVMCKAVTVSMCIVHWLLISPKLQLQRVKQYLTKVNENCGLLTRLEQSGIIHEIKLRTTQRIRERSSPQYSDSETRRRTQSHVSPCITTHVSETYKGRITCLNEEETSCNKSSNTCTRDFDFSASGQKNRIGREFCSGLWSASNSSSEEDAIKFTSGPGSESYHTADEWLAEDYCGNVIPDYRDKEAKLYEALLKMDFCSRDESYILIERA